MIQDNLMVKAKEFSARANVKKGGIGDVDLNAGGNSTILSLPGLAGISRKEGPRLHDE